MPSTQELFDAWATGVTNFMKDIVLTDTFPLGIYKYTVTNLTPTFLIPHPLVRSMKYVNVQVLETFKDDYLPSATMARATVEVEMTRILQEMLKKDPEFLSQNTSIYTGITSNLMKQQLIHRQLLKHKALRDRIIAILDHSKNREFVDSCRMIWRQHRMRKMQAIVNMDRDEAYHNALRYVIDHKESSMWPKLKYYMINSQMVNDAVDLLQSKYAPAILTLYEETPLHKFGYYTGTRVKGIRHKVGLATMTIEDKKLYISEDNYLSRDISGIPGGSQENMPIYGAELERIDKQLVNDLQRIVPFKIYTPYLSAPNMWKMLLYTDLNKRAYDGSNWQSHVPLAIKDLTSNIKEEFILLSSGHTETSPENFAGMITVVGCPTVVEELSLEAAAMYGDDLTGVTASEPKADIIPDIITGDDKDTKRGVHLGMSTVLHRVNAGKLVTDRPGNSFRHHDNKDHPVELNGHTRYSDVQKTAIAVQYGLIPFKDPFEYLTTTQVTDLYDKDEVFLKYVTNDKSYKELLGYYQKVLKPKWL